MLIKTANDIITGAMRLIGVVASGEKPSGAESIDGLFALNDLLESWSNDGFMVFEETRETFALIGGQNTYTIGVDGDFNTSRPQQITSANVIQVGDSSEIRIRCVNEKQWAAIQLKNTASEIPQKLYYNMKYPLGEVNLWPVPNAASTLVLHSRKPLSSFETIGTVVSLPPGYGKALRFNLAEEIAPEYGKEASPTVMRIARKTKTTIKRVNTKPVLLKNEVAGLVGGHAQFNYRTGGYS